MFRLQAPPHQLSSLTALELLDLQSNCFGATENRDAQWRRALAPLQRLQYLGLSGCQLSGRLPPVVGALPLRCLQLDGNTPVGGGGTDGGIQLAAEDVAHLEELVLDWPALFASHRALGAAAARLRRLFCCGKHATGAAALGGQVSGHDVAQSLGRLPALEEFVDVFPRTSDETSRACMELILAMRVTCPHADVRLAGSLRGWTLDQRKIIAQ